MNVIAYDRAYALYPRATFEEQISLFCKPVTQRDVQVISKYRARGFLIVHDWPTSDPFTLQPLPASIVPLSPRWIGDRYTWSVPLSLEGVKPPPALTPLSPPLTTDACFFTSWEIDSPYAPRFNGWVNFRMRSGVRVYYDVIRAPGFAYQYVCVKGDLGRRLRRAMGALQHLYITSQSAAPNLVEGSELGDGDDDEVTEPL